MRVSPQPLFDLLPLRPHLIAPEHVEAVNGRFADEGFRIVTVRADSQHVRTVDDLLGEISKALGLSTEGPVNWPAFNDWLGDLLVDEGKPLVIVVHGLDAILRRNVQAYLQCVHGLLGMTEAYRSPEYPELAQLEYVFPGAWAKFGGKA
ncbi:barstar family protein [Kineosporia mesophila]